MRIYEILCARRISKISVLQHQITAPSFSLAEIPASEDSEDMALETDWGYSVSRDVLSARYWTTVTTVTTADVDGTAEKAENMIRHT